MLLGSGLAIIENNELIAAQPGFDVVLAAWSDSDSPGMIWASAALAYSPSVDIDPKAVAKIALMSTAIVAGAVCPLTLGASCAVSGAASGGLAAIDAYDVYQACGNGKGPCTGAAIALALDVASIGLSSKIRGGLAAWGGVAKFGDLPQEAQLMFQWAAAGPQMLLTAGGSEITSMVDGGTTWRAPIWTTINGSGTSLTFSFIATI